MRIAWFSPFPPVRTGIADCSAELVAALRGRGHDIHPYPAESAHDFPWTHRRRPYDLIVYQFGNSSHHDYEWAYALRYPGLVVLHDTCLHHARAAFLLRERRPDDYRAEFAWSHPDAPRDAAELAVAGLDSRLFYAWPMIRALTESALLVATHGAASAVPSLASRRPVSIRLGHGAFVAPDAARAARARVRARYGIADTDVLFGVFGGLTPEKRLVQVLGALRAVVPYAASARLLLSGARAAHFDLDAAIEAHGLADRVLVTGYLPEQDLTDHLAACDVSLNLRWPSAGETSGAWLRALAAGVPTIITDLAHLADVPSLDPRTWAVRPSAARAPLSASRTPRSAAGSQGPVTVAIDILDEDHSLRMAMRRLALDPNLRAELGSNGQAWWQREHSLAAMVEDYETLFGMLGAGAGRQVSEPRAAGDVPAHLRAAGDGKLRALLEPFGVASPI
ncbi:MAG TPA: glycosyltransferase family 4 protein [Vicinamibacterales bacterium]|nr:glycosyltransferase family 4 protein [Vicinamibacterales bacterium]